ncbi:hypothetical protein Lepto7375DRAFT_4623 [Leptolyngbya sp. PCC 7375]|nr:hypothetical protein Lepto7375DRAFT_4623 [Leptolyngbya sp. PCC 7375]
MTKKRIADLLKEEVDKSNDAEQTPAPTPAQDSQPSKVGNGGTAETASGTSRTRKRTNKTSTASKQTTAKKATTKQTTTEASNTADLKKQIADLKTSLKQAQEQISGLQDDIKTHQTRIFELKDELETSQKVAADKSEALTKVTEELETAKETIRKITAQQEEAAQQEDTPTKVIHGADLAVNRHTLSLRNRPSSYKAIPEYAIQRGEHNSMLSDDDIGWVD